MTKIKKVKIILMSPWDSFFKEPHLKALSELGFECTFFNYRSGIVYTNRYVRKFFHAFPAAKFIKRLSIALTNKRLIRLVKDIKPRYLLAIKGENITPETIQVIRKMGVITLNFYADFMNQWHGISVIAPSYDFFFSPDHYILKKLREMGLNNSFYLPFSVNPIFKDPPFGESREYNISFVGAYDKDLYPNREKFLNSVKDLGLHVWGTDTWKDTELKDVFHGRTVSSQRYDIYKKSKIVIDINWNNLPAEGTSLRPFEVGYCGACLFSDLVRLDVSRIFEEGKEFVAFHDERDLREKIQYYLAHDSEREVIARACYEKVIKDHTYTARMRHMFEIIKNPEKYLYL